MDEALARAAHPCQELPLTLPRFTQHAVCRAVAQASGREASKQRVEREGAHAARTQLVERPRGAGWLFAERGGGRGKLAECAPTFARSCTQAESGLRLSTR